MDEFQPGEEVTGLGAAGGQCRGCPGFLLASPFSAGGGSQVVPVRPDHTPWVNPGLLAARPPLLPLFVPVPCCPPPVWRRALAASLSGASRGVAGDRPSLCSSSRELEVNTAGNRWASPLPMFRELADSSSLVVTHACLSPESCRCKSLRENARGVSWAVPPPQWGEAVCCGRRFTSYISERLE